MIDTYIIRNKIINAIEVANKSFKLKIDSDDIEKIASVVVRELKEITIVDLIEMFREGLKEMEEDY